MIRCKSLRAGWPQHGFYTLKCTNHHWSMQTPNLNVVQNTYESSPFSYTHTSGLIKLVPKQSPSQKRKKISKKNSIDFCFPLPNRCFSEPNPRSASKTTTLPKPNPQKAPLSQGKRTLNGHPQPGDTVLQRLMELLHLQPEQIWVQRLQIFTQLANGQPGRCLIGAQNGMLRFGSGEENRSGDYPYIWRSFKRTKNLQENMGPNH